MQKLLGTLNVYVDMDETGKSSALGQIDSKDFELLMYPNFKEHPDTTRHEFQTTMAHELGHFVARVTRDPSHNPAKGHTLMNRKSGDVINVNPEAEAKAWEIAHIIAPDLDEKREKMAMAGYAESIAFLDSQKEKSEAQLIEVLAAELVDNPEKMVMAEELQGIITKAIATAKSKAGRN